MIIFEFQIDKEELAIASKASLSEVEDSDFLINYFIMPVRLHINGIDIFQWQGGNYSRYPLLFLADPVVCRLMLEMKADQKDLVIEDFADAGDIILSRNNEEMTIRERTHKIGATVDRGELINAFKEFREKVRLFLNEHAPEMQKREDYGPWLRGELE